MRFTVPSPIFISVTMPPSPKLISPDVSLKTHKADIVLNDALALDSIIDDSDGDDSDEEEGHAVEDVDLDNEQKSVYGKPIQLAACSSENGGMRSQI